MQPRTVLAAVVTAAFVCLGIVVPATPAQAAGVPPVALQPCNGEHVDTGGWLSRDLVSTGTSSTDPVDVRPRNARLGEPCFDDLGGDDVLGVPVTLTDLPVPMLDVDEDGEDDGVPSSGPCNAVVGTASSPSVAEVLTLTDLCNELIPAYTTGPETFQPAPSGPFTVDVTGTNQVTIGLGSMVTGSNTRGFVLNLYCKSATGDLPTAVDDSDNVSWNTTLPIDRSLNCTLGTEVPWMVVVTSRTHPSGDGTRMMGAMWSSDALNPVGGGTSYYGGTQGAHFSFGAGTEWSVPDDGVVICASDYSAEDTVTYPVEAKGLGDFEALDRSPTPPVLVDGVATDWSIWQVFYPTDVLSGGVYESNCPYLVELRFWVCAFTGHGPLDYGCSEVRWLADRFRDRANYPGVDTPQESICDLYPNTPGCFEILNPPYVDGTDFAQVCAGAPEPTWAVWDWLFPWVGHMLNCLFIPVNGLDREGWIASAWEQSPFGGIGDIVAGIGNAMEIEGGCGMLVSGTVLGSAFEMDTCSWTWAAGGRQMLYWIIVVLGSLAAVGFILRSVLAIVNNRMPVPLDEDRR